MRFGLSEKIIFCLNTYQCMYIVNQSNVCFRGILLAEEQRYSEAVRSYENAIHFRPRLAGEKSIAVK